LPFLIVPCYTHIHEHYVYRVWCIAGKGGTMAFGKVFFGHIRSLPKSEKGNTTSSGKQNKYKVGSAISHFHNRRFKTEKYLYELFRIKYTSRLVHAKSTCLLFENFNIRISPAEKKAR